MESFLPGTTGYGQRGWFRELRTFIDRLAGTSVEFPSREEALLDLADPGGRRRPIVRPDVLPAPAMYRWTRVQARRAGRQNLFRFIPQNSNRWAMASQTLPRLTN